MQPTEVIIIKKMYILKYLLKTVKLIGIGMAVNRIRYET